MGAAGGQSAAVPARRVRAMIANDAARPQPPPMTVAEFLAWEEAQESRWEFDGFSPVAMTGGTEAHEFIKNNLIAALNAKLRGTPCRAYGSDLKIKVADRIRYPDAFVVCAPMVHRGTVRDDPMVVFEVLSPSTARIDRVEKMHEYWATPSIQRYVLIEQDAVSAMAFTRGEESWSGRVLWPGSVLALPELGIELPLDELYDGLDPAALREPR
jgi:Uma2 family endonuclease